MSWDKHIEEILAEFDFDRVRQTMKLLDWKWALLPNGPRVPKKRELREVAKRLLLNAVEQLGRSKMENAETGTGGLVAYASQAEGYRFLQLRFELTRWDSSDAD